MAKCNNGYGNLSMCKNGAATCTIFASGASEPHPRTFRHLKQNHFLELEILERDLRKMKHPPTPEM